LSLHTDLAIYQSADALFDLALDMQKHIPREFRLVVGQRVAGECADILLLVGRANKARAEARVGHLEALAERIEAVTILLRAAQRKRAISNGTWSKTIELTDSLGKQCTGWLKQTRAALGLPSLAPAT
jgi:hypothetical protein